MSNQDEVFDALGFNKGTLEKKKKRPDLDALADIDLTAGVEYRNPSTTVSHQGVQTTPRVQAGPAIGVSTGTSRLPNGELVSSERRIIQEASTTTLFEGNPRFGKKPDVSNLRRKIKKTGGNILPVICRLNNGAVEVVDGSRRRLASIEEGLPLLCDIIPDMSDEMASQISWMANQERDDPDVFEEAEFFISEFEKAKRRNEVSTVEQFASLYDMGKVNMHRYFSVGKIPEWLYGLCPRFKADVNGKLEPIWSLRSAVELGSLSKELEKIDEESIAQIKNKSFSGPYEVLRGLRKLLKMPGNKASEAKTMLTENGKEVGEYVLGKRKATLKVTLSESASDELKSKIMDLLNEYGVGK